jgi:hypothetical protein
MGSLVPPESESTYGCSRHGRRFGEARLTEEERAVILRELDLTGESTLGLDVLVEGADVPRDVTLRTFPATVVEQIPKLRDYMFITAEDRLAIVEQRGSKMQLVIEGRR